MFEVFTNPNAWFALLILTFIEIVLGIDNILFIHITASKLGKGNKKKQSR